MKMKARAEKKNVKAFERELKVAKARELEVNMGHRRLKHPFRETYKLLFIFSLSFQDTVDDKKKM